MDITKNLGSIAKALKANFTLNDRPINYDDVFSATGLLPAFCRRADQLASLVLGYGLGVSFDEADKSLLGVRVNFDDVTPNSLRIICITEIICGLMHSGPSMQSTPLDELMYD